MCRMDWYSQSLDATAIFAVTHDPRAEEEYATFRHRNFLKISLSTYQCLSFSFEVFIKGNCAHAGQLKSEEFQTLGRKDETRDVAIPTILVGVQIQKTEVIHRRSAIPSFGLIENLLMAASTREVYSFCVKSAHNRQRQILRYHVQLASKCHSIIVLLPIHAMIGEMDV